MKIIGKQIRYYNYKRGGRPANWGICKEIKNDTYKVYHAGHPVGDRFRYEKIKDVHEWLAEGSLFIKEQ